MTGAPKSTIMDVLQAIADAEAQDTTIGSRAMHRRTIMRAVSRGYARSAGATGWNRQEKFILTPAGRRELASRRENSALARSPGVP